jgi:uncharacterized membrane protein
MKEHAIKLLKKKGWTEDDIKKAEDIIAQRRLHDKSRSFRHTNTLLYWSAFILIIIGNFVISIALIPFLLVMNQTTLDIIIIIIGFSFGLFYNLILKDIEYISKVHHMITGFGIPVIALLNFFIMTKIANALNNIMKVSIAREDPFTIAAIYAVAFILPYFWSAWIKKKY